MIFLRALAIWGILLIGMFANGAFREIWLNYKVGLTRAHQISTLAGITIILLITGLLDFWLAITTAKDAWQIGIFWLTLTLVFECGMTLLTPGPSLKAKINKIAADYNLPAGRLWPLVLATVALTPRLWLWVNRGL